MLLGNGQSVDQHYRIADASESLEFAIQLIDKQLGAGYAKKNPVLLATIVQAVLVPDGLNAKDLSDAAERLANDLVVGFAHHRNGFGDGEQIASAIEQAFGVNEGQDMGALATAIRESVGEGKSLAQAIVDAGESIARAVRATRGIDDTSWLEGGPT